MKHILLYCFIAPLLLLIQLPWLFISFMIIAVPALFCIIMSCLTFEARNYRLSNKFDDAAELCLYIMGLPIHIIIKLIHTLP